MVVVAAIYLGRDVLIPITLAVLLSFILAPLANLLRRIGLGRIASVFLAVVLALGTVLTLGGLVGTQLADLAALTPRYQSAIQAKVETARNLTIGKMSAVFHRLGRQLEPGQTNPPAQAESNRVSRDATSEQKPLPVEVHQPDPSPLQLAESVLLPIVSPLSTLAIVFIVAIFVLLQRQDLRDRLIRMFGSRDLHRTTLALDDAADRLGRYFLTQLAVNAAFGIIIGIGLFIIGVPSPALWGGVGMLLRFVPYVGGLLSAVLPIALAAAVDPGWTMLLWTTALFVVVEIVIGQVIEPLLYGHSTGLSPVSVVVAAIFWTSLWGPIGLLLSTPLTLCLVVLGRHVDRLEFLDVMLGDRPALTPVENLYHRLLAGDADDALDQAELLLKDQSLCSYYDMVVMKSLRLAANDVERSVLDVAQLERIQTAVATLVHELSPHGEMDNAKTSASKNALGPSAAEKRLSKQPDPPLIRLAPEQLALGWQSEAPVLCISGRGPFDESASLMLAQLLGMHGIGAQEIPFEAVSRAEIGRLNVEGAAMVCLSYLDISGSPSHLRFLLKRLRLRLPGTPILVGYWQPDDAVERDERLQATIGVDHYVSSLREAVQACITLAKAQAPALNVS
ncbi:Predicted PurR-regulated permease PerM [Rhizobiales bacterium GAS113]|nr:Predicted PurR-regulated permease PerM [Rhizobiales bacterium GAS113]